MIWWQGVLPEKARMEKPIKKTMVVAYFAFVIFLIVMTVGSLIPQALYPWKAVTQQKGDCAEGLRLLGAQNFANELSWRASFHALHDTCEQEQKRHLWEHAYESHYKTQIELDWKKSVGR